jgi:hypothetical protein
MKTSFATTLCLAIVTMLALVPTADAKINGIRGKALAALLSAPRGLESQSRNPKWAKWAVKCEAAAKTTAEAATTQPSVEPLVPTADAKINGIRGKALAALLGAPRSLESQLHNPSQVGQVGGRVRGGGQEGRRGGHRATLRQADLPAGRPLKLSRTLALSSKLNLIHARNQGTGESVERWCCAS